MDGVTLTFSLLGAVDTGSGQAIGQAIVEAQVILLGCVAILAALALASYALRCVVSGDTYAEASDRHARQRVWDALNVDRADDRAGESVTRWRHER